MQKDFRIQFEPMDWVQKKALRRDTLDRERRTFWVALLSAMAHATDSYNRLFFEANGYEAKFGEQYADKAIVIMSPRTAAHNPDRAEMLLSADGRGVVVAYSKSGTRKELRFVLTEDQIPDVRLRDGDTLLDVEAASEYLLKPLLFPEG